MILLTLYTTSGCHLCEKAEQMLNFLQKQKVCRWVAIEISDDDLLVDRYGERIPVIATAEGRELGWPFTPEELINWLIPTVSG
ncbi:glutaredoxin family protein [Endozoicomonas sp. ONNA2]|uniref:glutaredoxin family protein n=1 Tax=Endozoicomonas sp. ONNA2 TaxID=2828741 RepID=UPI00214998E9|nr:glutaredoxin family protein [Endozoicomonas sp. ONNA2]